MERGDLVLVLERFPLGLGEVSLRSGLDHYQLLDDRLNINFFLEFD